MENKKYPALIQQWIDIQRQYPDAVVAIEIGSFFEILELDDLKIGHAIRISQLLDLKLTRKDKSKLDSPRMAGFPSHTSESYFKKMVDAGETVVVVEQLVRGRRADGNKDISRKITKILSPGIMIDHIKDSQKNYFGSLYMEDDLSAGVALIDVSTGEIVVSELKSTEVAEYLNKLNLRELLITGSFGEKIELFIQPIVHKNPESSKISKLTGAGKILGSIYGLNNPTSNQSYSVSSLGLDHIRLAALALSNLLNYLARAEYNSLLLKKISLPKIFQTKDHMFLPVNALLSLEVLESAYSKEAASTLLGVLDRCYTAMGKRKLRDWMAMPSVDLKVINKRHDKVEKYIQEKTTFEELKQVYDISRLARRMILGNLSPHELSHLYLSLQICFDILKKEQVGVHKNVKEIVQLIRDNLDVPGAEQATNDTDYTFFNGPLKEKVKELFVSWKESEEALLTYKKKIEEEIGTDKLRIEEKLDGIHLVGPKGLSKNKESKFKIVTKASSTQISDEKWDNLSTVYFANKQKYLLQAEREWVKFQQNLIDIHGLDLINISEAVAEIDVLGNFARISSDRGYCRPEILDKDHVEIDLKNLRHPVVENSKSLEENYVANDLSLGEKSQTLVIYGANSSGKSTILKALAINLIMNQMGCFIPVAKGSKISVVDSILTRMSTYDNLSQGLSTFTMEMTELQVALKYYNKRSVFLFDEIGRGTSVEDGEAIAYATLAYLNKPENNSITLFATHYHNLVEAIAKISNLEIKHLSCYTTSEGNLIFSRKLSDGPGEGSYGIEVARSCGLPEEIIRIAQRYSQEIAPIKTSRYNSKVVGDICPICKENPVQQTHHLVEQKQGQVKQYEDQGAVKGINNASNLLMICSSCHEKITRGEIQVSKKLGIKGSELLIEVTKVNKNE